MARPEVRPARFGDIPGIHALLAEAHGRSTWAHLPLDGKAAKALLVQAIQRHGGQGNGATFVGVAEGEAGIEGVIVGALQPVYFALSGLEATDLVWVVRPGSHAMTAGRLLRAMHRWAEASPRVVSIRQGTTDVLGDPERSGRLLERQGMRRTGRIHERRLP
jgi:hypothetical protein